MATNQVPRGIRNNNPLNLRKSNNRWLGKIVPGTDPAFEQFASMLYGIRAAMVNIRTQIRRNSQLTISQLIRIWAPASDGNNTAQYIRRVCKTTNRPAGEWLDFSDKAQIVDVAHAMAIVEVGRDLDIDWFKSAYDMI